MHYGNTKDVIKYQWYVYLTNVPVEVTVHFPDEVVLRLPLLCITISHTER